MMMTASLRFVGVTAIKDRVYTRPQRAASTYVLRLFATVNQVLNHLIMLDILDTTVATLEGENVNHLLELFLKSLKSGTPFIA